MREALPKLLESFQVLHLCGPGNADEALLGTPGYVQCEYLDSEMADAYACANILISRAGSNTLCEILALRKPALLIPYPMGASRGDQIVNARSFEARGLSRVLMQEDMTADRLVSEVISLYRDRGSLYEKMDKEPSANGVDNVLKEIYAVAERPLKTLNTRSPSRWWRRSFFRQLPSRAGAERKDRLHTA